MIPPKAGWRSWARVLLATFTEGKDWDRCEWISDRVFRECHNLHSYEC